MPTREQLENAVCAACSRLVDKDRPLFERDANERSLSHKFTMYLQEEVDAWGEIWDVDCEFNRDLKASEDYPKELNLIGKIETETSVYDADARTVFPDVIMHRRGTQNNLMVAELKKSTARKRDIEFDRHQKLPAYLDQLGYESAVFILLDVRKVRCSTEWIRSLARTVS